MKVQVIAASGTTDARYKLIAENTADEVFLKQLSGLYGADEIELDNVEFKADGVASLLIKKKFESIDEFCARVAACGGGGGGLTPVIVPDYINIQHLDPINPIFGAEGDRVIWGGYVWERTTGTASIIDEFTLDGYVQVPRVVGNGYFELPGEIETAAAIGDPNMVTKVRLSILNQIFELGFVTQDNSYLNPYNTMLGYVGGSNIHLSYDESIGQPTGIISNRLQGMHEIRQAEVKLNGGGGKMWKINGYAKFLENDIQGSIQEIKGGNILQNVLGNNGVIRRITANSNAIIQGNNIPNGSIDGLSMITGEARVLGNNIDNAGAIAACKINSARINGNLLTGGFDAGTQRTSQLAWCNLNDNCEINNNQLTGDGAVIWDVNALENSKVNDNILSGSGSRISAISQQDFDEVMGNELNGSGALLSIIMQHGNSKVNDNIIGAGSSITQVTMRLSQIVECDFSTGGTGIIGGFMKGAIIKNATNIRIQRYDIAGITWDLAGYTTDIIGHFYSNGKGNFGVKLGSIGAEGVIASIQSLTEDTAVPFNLIPKDHRVSRIYAQGDNLTASAGGVTIDFEVGTETIKSPTIAQLNAVNGVQQPNAGPWEIGELQTTNQPLKLIARGGDITGGELTIVVEYIKAD